MDDKLFIVTDDKGNEIEYEIVLTFNSPITGKEYVIYKSPDEDEEVLAAIYEEQEEGQGTLLEIETEEEWDIIQGVLDSFNAE